MMSPPTSACACRRSSIDWAVMSCRSERSSSPTAWPSYPITPRTVRPLDRAISASAPAFSGAQPHLGSPTLTSIRTSLTPPLTAASMVCFESTATVTRASIRPSREASTTSLASSKSSPRPASAMPSTSRMVAHVKVRWPASSWRRARAVLLCAFTCGRSRAPGSAVAMVEMLWSKASRSTRRAGVTSSSIRVTATRASCQRPALLGLDDHFEGAIDPLRKDAVCLGEVTQRISMRNQRPNPNPAVDHKRDDLAHLPRAGPDTDDFKLIEDHLLDWQRHSAQGNPDHRAATATAKHRHTPLKGLGRSRTLKRNLDAQAAGHLTHSRDRIAAAHIYGLVAECAHF